MRARRGYRFWLRRSVVDRTLWSVGLTLDGMLVSHATFETWVGAWVNVRLALAQGWFKGNRTSATALDSPDVREVVR